jgi:ribosome-associated protein
MKIIEIDREPVELYKVLKFEGLAASGGEAKQWIADERVEVNGMLETRKRRKLVNGDQIEVSGQRYRLELR